MQVVRALRTPRAAALVGVVFAILLTLIFVLLRLAAASAPTRAGALLSDARVSWTLRLVPFAGIAFLWLIGVVRDRIGEREDRFLATVMLGSGYLFVAMLFVASGVTAGMLSAATTSGGMDWVLANRISSVLLHTYAMRMAAVFTMSTATIGLRTGFIPRWLVLLAYSIALILLLGIELSRWVEVLFPLWIFALSVTILVQSFRETRRPRDEQKLRVERAAAS